MSAFKAIFPNIYNKRREPYEALKSMETGEGSSTIPNSHKDIESQSQTIKIIIDTEGY